MNWPKMHDGEIRYIFAETMGQRSHAPECVIGHGKGDPRLPGTGNIFDGLIADLDLDQFPAMRPASPFIDVRRMAAHGNGRPEEPSQNSVKSLCSKRLRFLKMKIALAAGRYRSQHYSHLHLACTASGCGHPGKEYELATSIKRFGRGRGQWSIDRSLSG
jgi:hypothetical protein